MRTLKLISHQYSAWSCRLAWLYTGDCDENSNPFEEMSGVFHENFTTKVFNGNDINCTNNNQPGGISKKRKLEETMDATGEGLFVRGRSFLPVRGGCDVFSTEDWKPTGTSLFCPVKQDVYVNLHKYDQITAAQGSFFTANENGDFQSSVVGHVIHLWRYDKVQRKQYISQSFLFTNQQGYQDENLKLASQQYRAWSYCTDVQAGLALYWWQRLIIFDVGRIRVKR